VANIIVIVGNNRDSTLRGCFGWGGRKLYVAGKYMAELTVVPEGETVTISCLEIVDGAVKIKLRSNLFKSHVDEHCLTVS
jgi:hypothetical protein